MNSPYTHDVNGVCECPDHMEHMGVAMSKLVDCPRCLGDGDEPGVPYDHYEYGVALCNLCLGGGEVPQDKALAYSEELGNEG